MMCNSKRAEDHWNDMIEFKVTRTEMLLVQVALTKLWNDLPNTDNKKEVGKLLGKATHTLEVN